MSGLLAGPVACLSIPCYGLTRPTIQAVVPKMACTPGAKMSLNRGMSRRGCDLLAGEVLLGGEAGLGLRRHDRVLQNYKSG